MALSKAPVNQMLVQEDEVCRRSRTIDLFRPQVMGVLNLTKDSFSDGGQFYTFDKAIAHAEKMIGEGADIIDVGAESTCLYSVAGPVEIKQEIDRVIPVVQHLMQNFSVPVSVDTSHAEVMKASIEAGASMINDVRGFQMPGAIEAVKDSDVTLCICAMHRVGIEHYQDVVAQTLAYLQERVDALVAAGISKDRICIDPGFGFPKTEAENLTLMQYLESFTKTGFPVLAGMSRKLFIGKILDKDVDQRLYGSVACAVIALAKGATIIRVHDVGPTVDAMKLACAVMNQG